MGATYTWRKTITLYESEARTLIALANERQLKLTVGHGLSI